MSSAPHTCVDLILIENHNIVVHNNAVFFVRMRSADFQISLACS